MAAYGIRVKGNSPWSLGGKGGMDYRDCLGLLGNNFYFLLIIILRNSKNYDFC